MIVALQIYAWAGQQRVPGFIPQWGIGNETGRALRTQTRVGNKLQVFPKSYFERLRFSYNIIILATLF